MLDSPLKSLCLEAYGRYQRGERVGKEQDFTANGSRRGFGVNRDRKLNFYAGDRLMVNMMAPAKQAANPPQPKPPQPAPVP